MSSTVTDDVMSTSAHLCPQDSECHDALVVLLLRLLCRQLQPTNQIDFPSLLELAASPTKRKQICSQNIPRSVLFRKIPKGGQKQIGRHFGVGGHRVSNLPLPPHETLPWKGYFYPYASCTYEKIPGPQLAKVKHTCLPGNKAIPDSHETKLLVDAEQCPLSEVFGSLDWRITHQHLPLDLGECDQRLQEQRPRFYNGDGLGLAPRLHPSVEMGNISLTLPYRDT